VRTLITVDDESIAQVDLDAMKELGITQYSYTKLLTMGSMLSSSAPLSMNLPKKDNVYLISYASGTTSDPKGAMLTHHNILSGLANCDFFGYTYHVSDVYLSQIPLSHVYEQIMLTDAIVFGFKVAFTRRGLPSDDQAQYVKMVMEDIQVAQPTIFGSFPLFYNKLYRNVMNRMAQESKPVRDGF